MGSQERLNLLRQDEQFKIIVSNWLKFKDSPDKAELWEAVKKRRALILNSPDPKQFIEEENSLIHRISVLTKSDLL